MNEIILKQMQKYPNTRKIARISYYSEYVLEQLHADTMFWQSSGELNSKKIPILILVDVCTRFTMFFVQKRKNEDIEGAIETFIKTIKKKFKKEKFSNDITMVTDGARELVVNKTIADFNIKNKLSTGINKAVIAEITIRQIRRILRKFELILNLENIETGSKLKIDKDNIKDIMKLIEDQMNQKAKLRKKPKSLPYKPSAFKIGDPVLALNFYKFYPHAVKSELTKKSYMQNYYMEPFYVSKINKIQGIYKYTLSDYSNNNELKFRFYEEELQKLDPSIASEYIKNFHKNALKTTLDELPQ